MTYSSSVHHQARQKHRDHAGEENPVERAGAADRGDGGAQALQPPQVEEIGANQDAKAAAEAKNWTKVIRSVRSPKTGAYTFKEAIVHKDKIKEFLAKK